MRWRKCAALAASFISQKPSTVSPALAPAITAASRQPRAPAVNNLNRTASGCRTTAIHCQPARLVIGQGQQLFRGQPLALSLLAIDWSSWAHLPKREEPHHRRRFPKGRECDGKRSGAPFSEAGPRSESGVAAALCHRTPNLCRRCGGVRSGLPGTPDAQEAIPKGRKRNADLIRPHNRSVRHP